MNDELFSIMIKDLPNFPEEVLADWLLPYALLPKYGWPPPEDLCLAPNWQTLLEDPLSVWRQHEWSMQEVDILNLPLTPRAFDSFKKMQAAYVSGERNNYSSILESEDGRERYLLARNYVLRNGIFPKPIILKKYASSYEVLDGSHRLLGLHSAIRIQQCLERASAEYDALLAKFNIVPVLSHQKVWVASLPNESVAWKMY